MIVINFVYSFVISTVIPYSETIKVVVCYDSSWGNHGSVQLRSLFKKEAAARNADHLWPVASWDLPWHLSWATLFLGCSQPVPDHLGSIKAWAFLLNVGLRNGHSLHWNSPWIAEAFSELHYSLCNFLHNLSFLHSPVSDLHHGLKAFLHPFTFYRWNPQ